MDRKNYKHKWYLENKEKTDSRHKVWSQTISGKYTSYSNNARKRFIIWDLTEEQFKTFWQKPCYYCGADIKTIGLDRKNNSDGYYVENVVPCCTCCNKMKSTLNSIDFINACKTISRRFMGIT